MSSPVTTRSPAFAIRKQTPQMANATNEAVVADAQVSDGALMAQICEGDKEAMACLFRRHARVVRGDSLPVFETPPKQMTWFRMYLFWVHRDCKTFDSSKGPARFWILQMAYRRAISRRRYLTSRHFYTRLDLDDAESELADPRSTPAKLDDLIDAGLENGPPSEGIYRRSRITSDKPCASSL